MCPQFPPVGHLIQFRNSDAILICWHFLGGDVHGHLRKVHIRADPRRGSNAGCGEDFLDEHLRHLTRCLLIGLEIGSQVNEHLINRVHMNIFRGYEFQIHIIDPGTGFHVVRHPGRGHDITERQGWIALQFGIIIGFSLQFTTRCFASAVSVDFLHTLDNFKKSCPA